MTDARVDLTIPVAAVNDNSRSATPAERALAYVMDMALATALTMMASVAATPLIVALGFAEPTVGFFLVANLVEFLTAMLFFAGFESSKIRATPGKRLVGLQVWTMNGGQIGLVRASWRFFCQVLSCLSLFGLFFIFFTKRQQTMHDLYSRTVVVKV